MYKRQVILSLDVILNYEPTDPDYVERYYANGCTVRDPSLGGTWEGDAPYWDDYYRDYMSYAIDDMKEISALCEEYGINLIVFTNPIYYRTYQQSKMCIRDRQMYCDCRRKRGKPGPSFLRNPEPGRRVPGCGTACGGG